MYITYIHTRHTRAEGPDAPPPGFPDPDPPHRWTRSFSPSRKLLFPARMFSPRVPCRSDSLAQTLCSRSPHYSTSTYLSPSRPYVSIPSSRLSHPRGNMLGVAATVVVEVAAVAMVEVAVAVALAAVLLLVVRARAVLP